MNPGHRGVDARALPSPKGQPMAFPFKAVIFDMDGVIVDTEKFYFDELAVMSEELGLGITEEERKRQEKLRKIDQVAYVRFASVYRQFKDINSFMEELSKIINTKKDS